MFKHSTKSSKGVRSLKCEKILVKNIIKQKKGGKYQIQSCFHVLQHTLTLTVDNLVHYSSISTSIFNKIHNECVSHSVIHVLLIHCTHSTQLLEDSQSLCLWLNMTFLSIREKTEHNLNHSGVWISYCHFFVHIEVESDFSVFGHTYWGLVKCVSL